MKYNAAEPDDIPSEAEINAWFTLIKKRPTKKAQKIMAPCCIFSVRYALRQKKKLSIDHACYGYRV